jgi:hypothetical protein
MSKVFFLGNDNALRVTVKDRDGAPDTGATVTADIVKRTGGDPVVSGAVLAHTANGVYEVIPDETLFETGQYIAQITVVGSANEDGYVELLFTARTRTT